MTTVTDTYVERYVALLRDGGHVTNVRTADFVTAVTAYEPHDSRYREHCGTIVFYDDGDGKRCASIHGADGFGRGWESAGYVLDDGRTAVPMYVACYRAPMEHAHPWPGVHPSNLVLHPYPMDYHADGRHILRADSSASSARFVDFSRWMLAPRRTYHVKVTAD